MGAFGGVEQESEVILSLLFLLFSKFVVRNVNLHVKKEGGKKSPAVLVVCRYVSKATFLETAF